MTVDRQPIVILIADDDDEDQMLLRETLEDRGLANDLRFVSNGEEVMAYLRREGKYADPASSPRPGMILLDLNMPRKDGRECLGEIKADPELADIPVFVLTTSRDADDVMQTYERGGSSFLSKPVTFDELLDLVTSVTGYRVQIVAG